MEMTVEKLKDEISKDQIVNYWAKRAQSFAQLRIEELQSNKCERWREEIESHLTGKENLRVLDVGTGCGFFAFLLADMGHQVTGIDLTESMIHEAKEISKGFEFSTDFSVMDAENLEFMDESFDVVISRNLTWTLPHAKQAYKEWHRVLKKGGLLLNYDGNYGSNSLQKVTLPENHVHNTIDSKLLAECDEIMKKLDMSNYSRPQWDKNVLKSLQFKQVEIDTSISNRIYKEIDDLYNPTPMFLLKAVK